MLILPVLFEVMYQDFADLFACTNLICRILRGTGQVVNGDKDIAYTHKILPLQWGKWYAFFESEFDAFFSRFFYLWCYFYLTYSFALTWTNRSVYSLYSWMLPRHVMDSCCLLLSNSRGSKYTHLDQHCRLLPWLDQDSSYILWSLIVSSDMKHKNGESFLDWGRRIHWSLVVV
jgi:hypothetical protein